MNYQNEYPVHVKETQKSGTCNQKKKKKGLFLLSEWIPADLKEMMIDDLKSTTLSPLPPKIYPVNQLPSFGVGISHLPGYIALKDYQGLAR